jgi:hypothetical protein
MAASAYLRRVSRQFSISAPRMAVRTHLGWPWRLGIAAGSLALLAGLWWSGFDLGRLFAGVDQSENEAQLATSRADLADAQRQAAELRSQNAQLASDLAMMRGLQSTLQRQQTEILQENAALKEELSFLQSFFADTARSGSLGIQRLAVDRAGTAVARYRVLLVRGAGAKSDFDGHLALLAELAPLDSGAAGSKPLTVALPDDRPEAAGSLRLRFKHYQRVEGTLSVPPGYALRAVTARAYESGVASPRATRTLTLP